MDDRDRLYLQIEINKLLSNNSLFSIMAVNFRSTLYLMFRQFFSSHFRERVFCFLCLNSSKCRYVYFQKEKTDKCKEKSKPKQQKKSKQKKNIYTVYTGLSSSEISFQSLAIHQIGVWLSL
jgi:hypothetical protein